MLHRTRQKLAGFTLVEILVVVMMIALLVTIGIVAWRGVDDRAFNSQVVHAMTSYRDAFALYASQEKQYPAVPQSGSYCLHFGGLTGAEVNSRWGTSRPTSITAQSVTETSYFCRDFVESTTVHASYPPLTKAIDSVLSVKLPGDNSTYLANTYSGGVWARYSGTAAASSIAIYGYFSGKTCPSGTTLSWNDDRKSICFINLSRSYPVTYTAESWGWPT
ncbi:prepilin-type N-terminal cleavage/methylation domain-containing protein [Candidatus Mycosynbacter amalyticus]|uniref:Prepilin-type N-terminal cleavage/methylation domain-containing protein n=1 Tax=Candidatus Mycosynbacter amalyticus TaxID=2665156 RepID=A0A857MKB7_9BACT|nr:type II secretion system protein [Candidatus Mycosynbacter amalyticus]QHN42578.1 prepilin-type N-terminal cleavage/methylation domain-containing protein [Candidatus Mycosynbacter amalyticus]